MVWKIVKTLIYFIPTNIIALPDVFKNINLIIISKPRVERGRVNKTIHPFFEIDKLDRDCSTLLSSLSI